MFRKLSQVMFCCRHFYRIRIEPHCKHRSIEFLTMQTDQSKGDILIDYVLNILSTEKKGLKTKEKTFWTFSVLSSSYSRSFNTQEPKNLWIKNTQCLILQTDFTHTVLCLWPCGLILVQRWQLMCWMLLSHCKICQNRRFYLLRFYSLELLLSKNDGFSGFCPLFF